MQETKEIINQVKKIELNTKKLVDGLIAGNYHSIFKGNGIEFSEIRDYRAGDDIRSIDWKVTARFNHPFIKEFIEERDLSIYFAIDLSASGSFGNTVTKKRKATELVASLMFSALKNNDNVGLFMITNQVEKFIPARKGRKHILKLISNLVSFKPTAKTTNLNKSLATISNIIKKRSIIFIVSDFYCDNFVKPLRYLKTKHDVIAIKVSDGREKEIPDIGLIELEDEETGEQILVDTTDKFFRNNYFEIIKKEDQRINSMFKKHKVDFLEIITDESYEKPLRKFFYARKKKMVV